MTEVNETWDVDKLIRYHRSLLNNVMERRGSAQEDITLFILALARMNVVIPADIISHGIATVHGWICSYWRALQTDKESSGDYKRYKFYDEFNYNIADITLCNDSNTARQTLQLSNLVVRCEKELIQMAALAHKYKVRVRVATKYSGYPQDSFGITELISFYEDKRHFTCYVIQTSGQENAHAFPRGQLVAKDPYRYPLPDIARIDDNDKQYNTIVFPRFYLRQIAWQESKARDFQIALHITRVNNKPRLPKFVVQLILSYHKKWIEFQATHPYKQSGADYYPRFDGKYIQHPTLAMDDFSDFEARRAMFPQTSYALAAQPVEYFGRGKNGGHAKRTGGRKKKN
jgi:hypothetical protein